MVATHFLSLKDLSLIFIAFDECRVSDGEPGAESGMRIWWRWSGTCCHLSWSCRRGPSQDLGEWRVSGGESGEWTYPELLLFRLYFSGGLVGDLH